MLARAIALTISIGFTAAQLSSGCTNTLTSIATNPDAASCLNLSALVPIFLGNSSSSIIDPVNNWVNGVCSSAPCSNATLSSVATNITTGCALELSALGVSSANASSLGPAIQQFYPTVRKIVCLKDSNTNCITQTLTNVQSIVGTLSVTNIVGVVAKFGQVQLPANVTCTDCMKAAYNIIKTDVPDLVSDAASAVQSQCGASFVDGNTPANIGQAAAAPATTSSASGSVSPIYGGALVGIATSLFIIMLPTSRCVRSLAAQMEPFSSPSRSRSSVPTKPEPGLAEWTSKIKAMQRQVDADEEAEQKRLEEEIAASRLARIRRSRGGHGTPSELPRTIQVDESPTDDMRHVTERQNSQAEALRKLSGVEDAVSRAPRESVTLSDTKPPRSSPASRTGEPISLAAFIGGRATGPRLNRHAPQQDAHDPTQFEQRTHIDAPHPVFGRGGVAMPGMSGRGAPRSLEPSRGNADPGDAVERYKPSRPATQPEAKDGPSGSPLIAKRYLENLGESGSTRERERTTSTPNSPYTRKIHTPTRMHEERPVSPQKTGGRERTTSSPSTPYSYSKKSHVPSMTTHEEERPISPQKTGGRERTISTPNTTYRNTNMGATSHATPDPIRFPIERSQTGMTERDVSTRDAYNSPPFSYGTPQSFIPRQHTLSTPQKSNITTPSLARPIHPEPRPSPQVPHIPASQTPSPAFLRLPPQKDPTPSISRLQGRGFVQNMVKVSSQLESPTSTSSTPDKSRSTAGRKVSVLDRWQPNSSPSNVSMSPPPSPGFSGARKPRTTDWTFSQREPTNTPKTPTRSLKSMSSLPSMSMSQKSTPTRSTPADTMPPESSPGLGSATTLIVYKPTLPPKEFTHVDELGIQHNIDVEAAKSAAGIPAPSGKPLVHPTRDRARRPRKGKEASRVVEKDEDRLSSVAPAQQVPWGIGPARHCGTGHHHVKVRVICSTAGVREPKSNGMVGRRALPGLIKDSKPQFQPNPPPHAPPSRNEVAFPSPTSPTSLTKASSPDASQDQGESSVSPKITGKHARIPSTGNRATKHSPGATVGLLASGSPSQVAAEPGPPQLMNTAAHSRLRNTTPSQPEKRRSNYERYSALMLPPLKEEATPTPSPAASLSRAAGPVQPGGDHESMKVEVKAELMRCTKSPTVSSVKPPVNWCISTISVDVMSIMGNSATTVAQNTHIFYDTEILAIVNRSKSKSTGLAGTAVWVWIGRKSNLGEKEERKLEEIAKRYGTAARRVRQHSESIQLIQILGGRAVTLELRKYCHAFSEISRYGDYYDEHDLGIQSLCSGYSYCVTILGTVYVWHGCGSTLPERQAAMRYAARLISNAASIIELSQGENDNDEMFWMILGEDDFANADYWKWRKTSPIIDPTRWRLNPSQKASPLVPIDSFLNEESPSRNVYILDCIWELFVMIGSESRGDRYSIRLAITIAMQMSAGVAVDRPYPPTVHVLVFPTKLPLDLRLHFRDLDELMLNGGNTPDHMNMLSSTDALIHLRKETWEEVALKDQQMLPLGLTPSDLPP
ncbi:hypothetical protein BD779DRAFT_1467564 [Infundibulicybe gibba]|nr:hypothetical protein BD779DRAFT_1467564 [Infundibulicybe gibba]